LGDCVYVVNIYAMFLDLTGPTDQSWSNKAAHVQVLTQPKAAFFSSAEKPKVIFSLNLQQRMFLHEVS